MTDTPSIIDISYDEGRQILRVTLAGGLTQTYLSVPSAVHAGLIAASSQAAFYAEHIRDRFQRA
jgi:hypothetical protein